MTHFSAYPTTLTIELPGWFPLVGTAIALIALLIAFLNFRRKSGLAIRGSFSLMSSIHSRDRYVSDVILENLKDRGVTIYAIYLRVGFNYYIELEKFNGKSLILKAYETHQLEFGPIQFYGSNGKKINLDNLLSDRSVRKQLVLSTSQGKYIVPKPVGAWNPVTTYFGNLMTALVMPMALIYKDRYIGAKVKFVVDIETTAKEREIVMLTAHSSEYRIFSDFQITKEALQSSDSLNDFFNQKIASGELSALSFTVHETSQWSKAKTEEYNEVIDSKKISWLRYFVIGRAMTWILQIQVGRRINAATRRVKSK